MLVSLGEMFTALRGWLVTAKDWTTLQFARSLRSPTALSWFVYYTWVGTGITAASVVFISDRPLWKFVLGLLAMMLLIFVGSVCMKLYETAIERRTADAAEKIRKELEWKLDAYRDANGVLSRDVEELQNRLSLTYTQLDEALRINHNHVTQALQRAQTGTAPTAAASLTTEGEQA